jgi:serine/threonine protein kinase
MMDLTQPTHPTPNINQHRHQSTYSSACYDLLEGLLCLDPARRLSAKAALSHEVGGWVGRWVVWCGAVIGWLWLFWSGRAPAAVAVSIGRSITSRSWPHGMRVPEMHPLARSMNKQPKPNSPNLFTTHTHIYIYSSHLQFFREPPAMTSPENFPRLPARRFH